MRQTDDRRDQRAAAAIRGQTTGEQAVDLESVNRQLGEAAERGEAGTEVVDCNADACGAQQPERVDAGGGVTQRPLGDLDVDSPGRIANQIADGLENLPRNIAGEILEAIGDLVGDPISERRPSEEKPVPKSSIAMRMPAARSSRSAWTQEEESPSAPSVISMSIPQAGSPTRSPMASRISPAILRGRFSRPSAIWLAIRSRRGGRARRSRYRSRRLQCGCLRRAAAGARGRRRRSHPAPPR